MKRLGCLICRQSLSALGVFPCTYEKMLGSGRETVGNPVDRRVIGFVHATSPARFSTGIVNTKEILCRMKHKSKR